LLARDTISIPAIYLSLILEVSIEKSFGRDNAAAVSSAAHPVANSLTNRSRGPPNEYQFQTNIRYGGPLPQALDGIEIFLSVIASTFTIIQFISSLNIS